MPDITVNTRDLDFVGEVKVRLKSPTTGKPTIYTKTQILADAAVEGVLTDLMAPDANTESQVKTGYVKDGGLNVLDTEGGIYANTYGLGKEIDYESTDYNGNIFLDVTV